MKFEKYTNNLPYPKRGDPDFREKLEAYHAETRRIIEVFKQDLFVELGLVDNPKKDLLFSKAWDLGHSNGFSEVYVYAVDLAELVQ